MITAENQVFEKLVFSSELLPKGEYENCTFKDCDFSNAHLSTYVFVDCEFVNCNLSLCKFKNSGLKTVTFRTCKVLGVNFSEATAFLFAVTFYDCQLNLSIFHNLKLKSTLFRNCELKETDFSDTDLSAGVFDNCDLSGCIFNNTNLEKADFRTAYHFSIDPERNRMKKARFARMGLDGLLHKYGLDVS